MPLTDTFVRQVKHTGAKAGDKHSDGGGMHLLVNAAGRYWRMNYRFEGKQKTLALGVYPAVTLAAARKLRDQAKETLANGIDPGEVRRAMKVVRGIERESFESVARKWLEKSGTKRGEDTQSRVVSWMEKDIFPVVGAMPIAAMRPKDILAAVHAIEARGAIDSARRVLGYCGQVFQYAMLVDAVEQDITSGLYRAMSEKEQSHYAAITEPGKLGCLLRAIDAYEGHPYATAALKLAPLVFVRPGELRGAEWSEFDLGTATWLIPGRRMKMRVDHIVPLASQSVAILREIYAITGGGSYAFPSIRSRDRPMSDNTINAALRSMGYPKDVMTGHGFRATARTILDEVLGERVDLIEHQLAHQVKDVNGRAYNRTAHLPARREMMQRWADYLDGIKAP